MGLHRKFNYLKHKFVFIYIFLTSIIAGVAGDDNIVGKLPFCDTDINDQRANSRRLVYVTTLDGTLSALDILNGGSVKWKIPTTPGGLLSSSIHSRELTNNGRWIRLIPSLSGGLYKFDGVSIEAIPITADNLLSSSFKFSDDLVISGGKETRSYGVSARTGQVLYECSMSGCHNRTNIEENKDETPQQEKEEHNSLLDDIVVVRRQTQTVRAIEPRTGAERWNFSVGQHEVELLKSDICHDNIATDLDKALLDIELKVVIPEGVICAVNKANNILWKQKFDHPIVSAWKPGNKDALNNVDMFTSGSWVWKNEENDNDQKKEIPLSPTVYVGMYQKQLYIQESNALQKLLHKASGEYSQQSITDESNYPRIPWKPFPATSSALALVEDDNSDIIDGDFISSDEDKSIIPSATALSVLYASEYVNGKGFYFYSSDDFNTTQNGLCDPDNNSISSEKDGCNTDYEFLNVDNKKPPLNVVFNFLWSWKFEVVILSIIWVILVNWLFNRGQTSQREIVFVERHIEIPVPMEQKSTADDSALKSRPSQRSLSESNNDNFVSRFTTDFDLMQCLGKGGFGVVFEAKNKLDDCNYAIKRIILPSKQESRDRVLREVKTLANCEHPNIVRYFQAWVETPPPGWQEKQDKEWMARDSLSTSIEIDSPSEMSKSNNVINELLNNNYNKKMESWITNLNTNECINFDDEMRKTKFSNITNTDDDSFIQFKTDSNEFSNSVFNKNKDNETANDEDDSFDIQFKNSSTNNTESISKTNGDKEHIISINSFSTTISDVLSISRKPNKKCTNNLNILPLKKTHRRPLSLDLTSTGNVFFSPNNRMYLYIQMQLCRKQSLKEWLQLNSSEMRQDHIVPIFEQVIGAVEYVHLKGLIHRDLKPSNIFFSLDGQIKIGDFGLVTDMSDIVDVCTPNGDCSIDDTSAASSLYNKHHTQQVGTHLYMSPEQMQGRSYNYKVDIYSLGLILFELLVAFSTEMERIHTLKGLREFAFPDKFQNLYSNEYELLKLMLSESPKDRPTTFGIRARPPLNHKSVETDWHFELPPRRRESRSSNSATTMGSSSGSSKELSKSLFNDK